MARKSLPAEIVAGKLEVWHNAEAEVFLTDPLRNLPGDPVKDQGYYFSVRQARHLATLLLKHAALAEKLYHRKLRAVVRRTRGG